MKKRPVGITVLAVFTLLSSVFHLISLCILFLDDETTMESSLIGVPVLFIFLRVVIAVGFLKGWSWTHIVASIAFSITGYQRLTAVGKSDEPQMMLLASAVTLAIAFYLLASPKVRNYFYSKGKNSE